MDINKNVPENEEAERKVTLLDADSEEHRFEILDVFDLNGETYLFLVPDEDKGEEAEDVLIMTIETDENGQEQYFLVEDEAELDMAYEEFKRRVSEEFDFAD